jgi:hypothetical protein
MELYQQGLISATISGHPCETCSSARWHEPPEEFRHIKWPRPLRTAERLFGLDRRTWRELQQTRLGTSFFLQTVWVLACHVAYGGVLLEEHPGIPFHDYQPSIWRSAIVELFGQHPDIRLHQIGHWRFAAPSVKPTGLWTFRLPHFLRDLYAFADPFVRKPDTQSIGLDSGGAFRTSVHKEYPSRLSAGFASAIAKQLAFDFRAHRISFCERPSIFVTGSMKWQVTAPLCVRTPRGFQIFKVDWEFSPTSRMCRGCKGETF